MEHASHKKDTSPKGLSSAKREDIWALIIAGAIMAISMITPEGVHHFFKKVLFLF